MNNQNIEIILNEEYGYRYWSWTPNMTETEFVNWWKSLTDTDIIKYYFNIKSLPGSIRQMELNENSNDIKKYYCHFHDVDDSYLVFNGEKIPYQRTTRRDWKENWVDYQIKTDKKTQNI